MTLKLAWRNLWRNRTRSLLLVSSITLGFFSLFFFMSVAKGAVFQAIENLINSGTGHIQIHLRGYLQDPDIKKEIKHPRRLLSLLRSPSIRLAAYRINLTGIISSPEESRPVRALGGLPPVERTMTNFSSYIVEGKFPWKEDGILLGKALASMLRVELGDRVVITSSDREGNLSTYAFRVRGIFKTPSQQINKYLVLIHYRAAVELAGYRDGANEIVIKLKKGSRVEEEKRRLSSLLGDKYEVLAWYDVYPLLKYEMDAFSRMMLIFGFIILLGASFGIAEVFFMAVYERMREIGILRSLGVSPSGITRIFLAEALLLSTVSLLLGGFLSLVFYLYFSSRGLNLSVFRRSLEVWGSGSVIYPRISPWEVLQLVLLVFLVVLLSVLLPLRKARKIKPAEALRYV